MTFLATGPLSLVESSRIICYLLGAVPVTSNSLSEQFIIFATRKD